MKGDKSEVRTILSPFIASYLFRSGPAFKYLNIDFNEKTHPKISSLKTSYVSSSVDNFSTMKKVFRKIFKWLGYLVLGVFLILIGIYLYLAMQTGKPAEARAIFNN